MKMISTQRYLDYDVVDRKVAARDYDAHAVRLAINGEEMLYIVGGHHAIRAAIESGVEPNITINHDIQHEADAMALDDFLEAYWMDSEPYDIMTGENVF